MIELLAILTPILVVDFLNPVLLGLLVFAAASQRPVINSTAMLIGHTIAYFAVGVVLAYGVEQLEELLADWWNNPTALNFIISIVAGIGCFYWIFKPPGDQAQKQEPEWEMTPAKCFGLGVALSVIGAPFALPYIGAISQILKADVSLASAWTALVIYNIGYALPFSVVPGAVLLMGREAKPVLDQINEKMVAIIAVGMPWLIGLLGTWLVFDGVYYFIVGEPVI